MAHSPRFQKITRSWTRRSSVLLGSVLLTFQAWAAAPTLHVYSARHYPSDTELYANFTAQTGIDIKRVDSNDAGILARLKAEGKASPADVILLVDAARLHSGQQKGLFKPVSVPALEARVPATLRGTPDANGKTPWFGISSRARIIVYDKQRFKASDIPSYEALANSALKGEFCMRSSAHPYNLSLFSAFLAQHGEASTRTWLQGLRENLARQPQGGDTDQIRGVASGECGVAIANSYYLARLMRSTKAQDREVANRVGVVFPGQSTWGTHVNVAGAAVAANTSQPELAIQFIEYLTSPKAQAHFAQGNNEWPTVSGIPLNNDALEAMAPASFKRDTTPVAQIGANTAKVQRILDELRLP